MAESIHFAGKLASKYAYLKVTNQEIKIRSRSPDQATKRRPPKTSVDKRLGRNRAQKIGAIVDVERPSSASLECGRHIGDLERTLHVVLSSPSYRFHREQHSAG